MNGTSPIRLVAVLLPRPSYSNVSKLSVVKPSISGMNEMTYDELESAAAAPTTKSLFARTSLPVFTPHNLETIRWAEANSIICGDAEAVMFAMPRGVANMIVTSPPYYGQRDYGVSGQMGGEGSPSEYVDRLVKTFRAARRALRDDGTLWLNLGDKYVDGQLLGMPWRVALALV